MEPVRRDRGRQSDCDKGLGGEVDDVERGLVAGLSTEDLQPDERTRDPGEQQDTR